MTRYIPHLNPANTFHGTQIGIQGIVLSTNGKLQCLGRIVIRWDERHISEGYQFIRLFVPGYWVIYHWLFGYLIFIIVMNEYMCN